jgi:hypothetical protein
MKPTMTPSEKQKTFHSELKTLLRKYNAELCLETDYVMYEQRSRIVVDFGFDPEMWDQSGDGIVPQLVIGNFEDGK